MKELGKEFEGKGEMSGTKFKQMFKSEKAFMYKLKDIETGEIRYEVFEKREQKASESIIGGQTVIFEEKELYPKTNAFGDWAWCFRDAKKAFEKYEELTNAPDKIKKDE